MMESFPTPPADLIRPRRHRKNPPERLGAGAKKLVPASRTAWDSRRTAVRPGPRYPRVSTMSVLALVATGVLALWLLASIDRTLPRSRLGRILAPLDRFRCFGPWAMFAAGEGRKGAYGLAYRDLEYSGHEPAWTVAATGHRWSWHGFILDPRASLAHAVHGTARELHRQLQRPPSPAAEREIELAQARLRRHLLRLAPPPPAVRREWGVIKEFAADDSPARIVVCRFPADPDVRH